MDQKPARSNNGKFIRFLSMESDASSWSSAMRRFFVCCTRPSNYPQRSSREFNLSFKPRVPYVTLSSSLLLDHNMLLQYSTVLSIGNVTNRYLQYSIHALCQIWCCEWYLCRKSQWRQQDCTHTQSIECAVQSCFVQSQWWVSVLTVNFFRE